MSSDTQCLVQRWIDRFGEPPVLIDEPLMQALLAEGDSGDDGPAASPSQ